MWKTTTSDLSRLHFSNFNIGILKLKKNIFELKLVDEIYLNCFALSKSIVVIN